MEGNTTAGGITSCGDSEGGDCLVHGLSGFRSPQAKKLCQNSTPESFKLFTSTPVQRYQNSKAVRGHVFSPLLTRESPDSFTKEAQFRVTNVPYPFMERLFITSLEKMRKRGKGLLPDVKSVILGCLDYSREHNSVVVRCVSQEVSDYFLRLEDCHFMHSTLIFEAVEELGIQSYSSDGLHQSSSVEATDNDSRSGLHLYSDDKEAKNDNNNRRHPSFSAEESEDDSNNGLYLDSGATATDNDSSDIVYDKTLTVSTIHEKALEHILDDDAWKELAQFNTQGRYQRLPMNPVVKVCNLPKFFFEPHFENFLNDTAAIYNIGEEGISAVKSVNNYSKDKNSCSVEFISEGIAEEMCHITPLVYDKSKITLEMETLQSTLSPSPFVKVCNLPKFFFQPHFENFLNDTAATYNIEEEGIPAVKSVNYYSKDKNSCTVEFVSARIAEGRCLINPIVYDNNEITLELETLPNTDQEKVVVLSPSPFVKVCNLPKFFFQPHFENFLNDIAATYYIGEEGIAAVKSVNDYSKDNNSCTVEFVSERIAEGMCLINPVVYDNNEITLELETLQNTDREKVVALSPSPFVKVCNLPKFFFQPHFENFLNDTATTYYIGEEGIPALKSVNDYSKDQNSCSVEVGYKSGHTEPVDAIFTDPIVSSIRRAVRTKAHQELSAEILSLLVK